jgi:hypothetical protein
VVVMVVVSDKNSVSQSAVQFVATENKNVICYHGSTIEKIDDPNFHKAHDEYFAFQVKYSDFLLTGLQLWPQYWGHYLGSFFRGAYLPQKSELAPPLDREGMPVQKYVPSYLTKFNPIWFI